MREHLISVIIPVYNIENYIGRCVASVIGNTYTNLQIICVNDGSTDHSLDILEEYAAKDPRIEIIDKPNGGLPSARNVGMDAAKGEFICHIDGDDWVHYQYFELLMRAWEINGSDADLVICRELITDQLYVKEKHIDTFDWDITLSNSELIKRHPECYVYIWARMYRKDLIGDFRQELTIINGEDRTYNFCILGKKENIKVVSVDTDPLYYYFVRSDSISRSTTGREWWQIPYGVYKSFPIIQAESTKRYAHEFVLKRTLSNRYESTFIDRKFPESKPDYGAIISDVLEIMDRNNEISFAEKAKIIIAWKIPPLYRLFRLMTDRTLFRWEKMEKERVRKLMSPEGLK